MFKRRIALDLEPEQRFSLTMSVPQYCMSFIYDVPSFIFTILHAFFCQVKKMHRISGLIYIKNSNLLSLLSLTSVKTILISLLADSWSIFHLMRFR